MSNNSPLGVIDIGTNTFHILIVKAVENGFTILHKERIYVKLGQGGTDMINEAAFQRGLLAMNSFRKVLNKFNCSQYRCIGTAAMRSSKNAALFKEKVEETSGIAIEVISGLQEADFIFNGIKQAYPMTNENVLVMDIGGGSIEYILANNEKIFFAESYPIGMTILKKKFHGNDPMTEDEKNNLKTFVLNELKSLTAAINLHQPKVLVGSSGTFEVLDTKLPLCKAINNNCTDINYKEFIKFHHIATTLSMSQLNAQQLVPQNRIDLISVAIQLIKITCELSDIEKLISSRYALKEGVLQNMF